MANSLVGYIALLRQLCSFYKGWVGDRLVERKMAVYKNPCILNQHLPLQNFF